MTNALRRSCFFGLLALSVPGVALAQNAEDLIKNGKDLVEQGKIDQGCAMIFQAEAEQPTVQSIGLVAACHEKQGKLAQAYREYMTTADRAAKASDDRQKFALDQAAALEKRIGRVNVKPAPGDAPKITVGGDPYAPPQMVDPGSVTVIATDASGKTWKKDVTVAAGASAEVDVPPVASWAGGVVGPSQPTEKHYASGPPASAVVAGFVGIAGLGVMAGAGIATIVLNNKANSAKAMDGSPCSKNDNAHECADALSQHNHALTASTVADVGLGVGVVGIGLATIFWAAHVGASPVDDKQKAAIPVDFIPMSGGGALTLRGEF